MSTEETPERVYEAVARDRLDRWAYDTTLEPEEQARFIAEQVGDHNLRADADIVWRCTTGRES